jgi:hypothetical protein
MILREGLGDVVERRKIDRVSVLGLVAFDVMPFEVALEAIGRSLGHGEVRHGSFTSQAGHIL